MIRAFIHFLGALRRNRRGSVTVEYAMLLLPALMLLFGTFEMGLMIFESSVVEGATREAARKVRTGAVQTNADPIGTFRQSFCTNLFGLFGCNSFSFDVRNFPDFTNIALPAVTYDAQGNPSNTQFSPGGAGTVTTVRVIYKHSFATR